MCLKTNTPLIESGTAEFLGQVQVIVNVRKRKKKIEISNLNEVALNYCRAKLNAMNAHQRNRQKHSRFVPFERLLPSLFTVQFGQKHIYSLNSLD